jgi:uncharacterized protein (DUF1697 family)
MPSKPIAGQYLGLLRGINVGGSNIVSMIDLKACFENLGCTDVLTYIQSGNVIFRSQEKDAAKLAAIIERALAARFGRPSKVVVLGHEQLQHIVRQAPSGFGRQPAKYRYDVIFLKEPLTAAAAMNSISVNEGVDAAHKGKGVLYFSRLISQATRSHLRKIITLPIYQQMTIRNWNTTTKLLELMDPHSP